MEQQTGDTRGIARAGRDHAGTGGVGGRRQGKSQGKNWGAVFTVRYGTGAGVGRQGGALGTVPAGGCYCLSFLVGLLFLPLAGPGPGLGEKGSVFPGRGFPGRGFPDISWGRVFTRRRQRRDAAMPYLRKTGV